MAFHILDYVVFGLVLLISLGIGIFFSFRQKSTNEYFMGGRQLKLLPVTISITATITSAHSLLGTPAEIYAQGTQYFMHVFGVFLGTLLGGFLFVPLFHPLGLTSVFEYLESRFRSRATRLVLNVIMIICHSVVSSAGIYGPSVAMHTMTGLPTWLIILLFGVTTTIYTAIGGMKGVILADVFQAIFIYAGVIAVCVLGLIKVGGFGAALDLHRNWDRLNFFIVDPDPTVHPSFWSSVIGYAFLAFCLSHIQASMQRYCGLPSLATAKRSMYLSAGLLFCSHFLFSLSGFAAFAYFASISCDPLRAKIIRSPNQILPYFVMKIMTVPGLPGLFVACMASTALSTSSSLLNGYAAVIWEDYMSHRFKRWSERSKTTAAKVIAFLLGIIGILLAFLLTNVKGTLVQFVIGIAGALVGPVTGIYVLGAINPRANSKAAAIGLAASLSLTLLLSIGSIALKTNQFLAPSPVSGCEARNMRNFTMSENITENVSLGALHASNNETMQMFNDKMEEEPGQLGANQTKRTAYESFFSVSFLYFPVIGVCATAIVGSLLAVIPYFATDYHVEDKYLFEFVRKIRNRKFGKENIQVEPLKEKVLNGEPFAEKTAF